jgi:hypothetical protein
MLFRVFLALFLLVQALSEARKLEPLALLLAPMTLSAVVFTICEQPTEQGFMVIGIAFTLAALKLSAQRMALAPARNVRPAILRYSMRRPEQAGAGSGRSPA